MRFNDMYNTLQSLTHSNVSQSEIARILGVSRSNINYKKDNNVNLSDDDVLKIETHFKLSLKQGNNEICVNVLYRPNVYLSAGYGVEVYDEQAETICLDTKLFITDRGIKINPDNCEIVAISGNSMSPEYRHGDRVILDKSVKNWIDGHIFAFRFNGECFVKEICLLGKRVKAIPLNKEYEPFFIEETDDVEILGRVVPRVRF